MNKSNIFLVLLLVLFPLVANAQTQNVELGLQVGTAFFMGNTNPASGYTRTNEFAWLRDSEGMPAFETFGGMARYRFDYRWTLQMQAMRQRVRYKEISEKYNNGLFFYNSMWNWDIIAEYNFLRYGFVENRNAKIYTVTPYIGLGLGASFYTKHATYRWGLNDVKKNTAFPAVRTNDLTAAMYVPFVFGVKLRMDKNWQFKVACQYDLYVLNGDLNGNTEGSLKIKKDPSAGMAYPGGGGVTLGKYQPASTHNIMATVAVIYNLPANDRGGIINLH